MLSPPRHYVYLDAVARAGSIRKAAEKLHVASTALNRKILEVESEVGTPLFERLPRGVRLTAAGELLVASIRRGMADLRSVTSQIEQLRGLVRGTVRIGCAESVASDLLPIAVGHYQQTHPGVQFQLVSGVTGVLVATLLRDEVEMVLVHDPQPSDSLRIVCAVPQPLCVMMRPDHALAGRSGVRLSDLQEFSVALGDQSFGSRRLLDAVLASNRMEFKVALEASSVQTLKEFTRLTGALSFQFHIGTQQEVRRGELVSVPLTDAPFTRSQLMLATRAGRMLPMATMSFMDVLVARLAQVQD